MAQAPLDSTVLVTPRSFGIGDPDLRRELAKAVRAVRYNESGRPLRAAELRTALEDVDGLLAGLDEIDASVIAAAPQLRVIARYGVGISNVDLEAAARAGVVVTNTPGANAEAVAELAIGFLFALARSISRADRAARSGNWYVLPGSELSGKTVGILGLGKIGQAVARRALALGCTVLAYDPILDPAFNARYEVHATSLDEVVHEAHFLTLHLPLLPETRDLVNGDLLARMRKGSFLINTARGELLVEEDLLWALENGPLIGAALDTLRVEPPPPDHPLLAREDVIITPHIGANTTEARAAMGRIALHDLLAVLEGEPPRFPVTVSSGGH